MARILSHPLAVDAGGRLSAITARSDVHASQAVAVLAATIVGERVARPTYGLPDPVGEVGFDVDELYAAASRWVPFAEVDAEFAYDPDEQGTLDVTARVRRAQ